MVGFGRQLLLLLGLFLSVSLGEQGLRANAADSSDSEGEGVISSMFGQLRNAFALEPAEKDSPVTSLYETVGNASEKGNSSTGSVITVTLNSELQETAHQRSVKPHQ
mmetsp:Transcript_30170/g.56588  ORF Transcript_30170/g.56588 Transcript_30170/m.56588 type:complete len:107 (+) Transcript_30170:66-386(+)